MFLNNFNALCVYMGTGPGGVLDCILKEGYLCELIRIELPSLSFFFF